MEAAQNAADVSQEMSTGGRMRAADLTAILDLLSKCLLLVMMLVTPSSKREGAAVRRQERRMEEEEEEVRRQ